MTDISLKLKSQGALARLIIVSNRVRYLSSHQLVVDTPLDYMGRHQRGDGVPQRVFLGTSAADRRRLAVIAAQGIAVPLVSGQTEDQREIEIYNRMGEYLLQATDDRFVQEIAPDGTPWLPNSPRTIAHKRRLGRILKILQSTGRGRHSIRYRIRRR